MNICFDVDGCLKEKNEPIKANIMLLKVLSKSHKVYLWSGNGWQYALNFALEYKLPISGVLDKYNTFLPDIAFDDKEINLGKLNIKL